MKINCVVFDFDRTLMNLTDFVDWKYARQLILQTYRNNGAPENLVKQFHKGSFYLLLIKIPEELLKYLSPHEVKKIQSAVFAVLEESEAEGILNSELMPGCLDTLQWLTNKDIKIGIASSNSDSVIQEILRIHHINFLIKAIVARDIRYRMKPHPDQFLLCMKKIGCNSQHSIAVGDSRWDIIAAKEAGMFAIGVLTGLSGKEELLAVKPDRIIRSLYELPNLLITIDPSLKN